ncbi:MAG: hypothetical protein N2109_01130 [Fimbriimonadales bacterium]|nr:hypothetical protein [Fimbriimonadales bacterium]
MNRRQRFELLFLGLLRNRVRRVLASNLSAEEKAESLRRLARRQAWRGFEYERRFWQGVLGQSPSSGLFAELAQLRRRASAFLEASERQLRYERKKAAEALEPPFMDYSS